MTDRSVSRQQEALIISGKRKRERMREEPRIKHIFFPAHLTRVYLIWRQQDAAFCFLWPVFTSRPPSSASLYEWLKAIQEYFMFDKMRQGQGLLLSSSKAESLWGDRWRVTLMAEPSLTAAWSDQKSEARFFQTEIWERRFLVSRSHDSCDFLNVTQIRNIINTGLKYKIKHSDRK